MIRRIGIHFNIWNDCDLVSRVYKRKVECTVHVYERANVILTYNHPEIKSLLISLVISQTSLRNSDITSHFISVLSNAYHMTTLECCSDIKFSRNEVMMNI